MIKNYFKTAWRSLIKNKGYSVLNILGLATGMGVAMLIGLWVYYQFSYDKFLPDYGQVYQVKRNFYGNGDTVTGLMAGDKKFYLEGGMVAKEFLKIFQYDLLEGNQNSVLQNPYSIVLTQSIATALFGKEDPLNKTVRLDNKNDLKVTGILKDISANSTLQFKYLVPFSYLENTDSFVKNARTAGFGWTNFMTVVKLKHGISSENIARKLTNIEKTETDNSMSMTTNIILDPLKNWHLYEKFEKGKAVGGLIDYVRIFMLTGILVLIIACINFINLTTARSESRAREVGVRKAIGSGRNRLIFQFLTESILLTFVAFIFSLLFVQIILPFFNMLTHSAIKFPFTQFIFWLIALSCVLITGLIAGSRPAFYLSSFEPVKVLKGNIRAGKSGTMSRKVLVVLQFSCSIALISCTYIIYQQVRYAKDRPAGYNIKRLMITDMNEDLGHTYTAIKNELIEKGIIESVTTATARITTTGNHRDVDDWQGKKPGESVDMGVIKISDDYFKTLGILMKEGRDFQAPSDTVNVIFTEAAVKLLRLQDPINQTITWLDSKLRIIGVVKNTMMASPYAPADPTIYLYDPHPQNVIMYRIPARVKPQDAIAKLTAIFNKYNPAYPYTYSFADDDYAAKFQWVVLIGKLAGLFAALAIFISCLGLLGLAAYVAEQRTKEIGIRRVVGASVSQVWLLLSKDFIVLVLISCVVATPVAFYYMQSWLGQYSYRIEISPFVFILTALTAMTIAIITVSFQSINAALANPVKSLRTE